VSDDRLLQFVSRWVVMCVGTGYDEVVLSGLERCLSLELLCELQHSVVEDEFI